MFRLSVLGGRVNDNDIAYIAAAKQPIDKTLQHMAALDSGIFSSLRKRLSILTPKEWESIHAHSSESHKNAIITEQERAALLEEQKHIGLSKGAKVGHTKNADKIAKIDRRQRVLNKALRQSSIMASSESYFSHDGLYESAARTHQGKSRFYVMSRDWAGQYKGQMIYQPRPCDAPAVNVGERYTEKLTASSVRKIFESGAYVAACHGGFTTFITLTFSAEQRNDIFSGNVTLGSEVSRFINAAKKMHKRGFTYVTETGAQSVEGIDADFHYIWVAECPANEEGEPNPHVHMLLNWQVDKAHFNAWASRIEGIWKNGFAHLERIKFGEAAAGYLIKAVGYAAKGGNADQGLIKGNRYNIARCSRAPSWEVLASFDADNMAGIIKECGYKLTQWRKPLEREIRRKNAKRDEFIRLRSIHKAAKDKTAIFSKKIKQLEAEARDIKAQIKARGVFARCDNSFSITFEGDQAITKIDTFLSWAAGARGWSMASGDCDLSDIKSAVDRVYSDDFLAFQYKQANWKSQLQQHYEATPDNEENDRIQSVLARQWGEYEKLYH
jgi:hypothetical protein